MHIGESFFILMITTAILSDIHSNYFALKAVVEHAEARGVTRFINLGDSFYGPMAPRKTYEFLQSRDFITISGNQDRLLYEVTEREIADNPTMKFVLDQLGDGAIEWLKSLPFDLQFDDLYCCHGSPDDDLCYLLEDVSSGSPQIKDDEELIEATKNISAQVILCGHSHLPNCVELATGQLIINPGSVGLPAYSDDEPFPHSMQNYSSKASYAILAADSSSFNNVEFHRVDYPVQEAVDAALKLDRADWAHFLSTGRK